MENTPSPKEQIKQLRISLLINFAMAAYALSTLIKAIGAGVAWRVLVSGVGSVFFMVMFITLIIRFNKLRKAA